MIAKTSKIIILVQKEMIDEIILKQKTPEGLRAVLEEFQMDIETVKNDEQLDKLEKNRLLLIYYSNLEDPFLAGDRVEICYKDSFCTVILLGFYADSGYAQKDFLDENSKESLQTPILIPGERYVLIEGIVTVVGEKAITYPNPKPLTKPLDKNLAEKVIRGRMHSKWLNSFGSQAEDSKPRLFSREDVRTPWYEYVEGSSPLVNQVEELFKLFTVFEDPEIVTPVIVTSVCVPSAIAGSAPISVFYGESGTGKSSCCHVVSGLYGMPMLVSSVTYAGLRNFIENHRQINSPEYVGEKNINVVIDEISPVFLNNRNMYSMLKSGTNYATSRIETSREKSGKNNMFYSFSPKTFSTCWNFWNNPEFIEIQRRIFVFKTQKVPRGTFVDKEDINYNECNRPLSQMLQDFWAEKQPQYKEILKAARGNDRDMIATMCCLYDISIEEAKENLQKYKILRNGQELRSDAKTSFIDSYLESFEKQAEAIYSYKVKEGSSEPQSIIQVAAKELGVAFRGAASQGVFSLSTNIADEISAQMKSRGYTLEPRRNQEMTEAADFYWCKQYAPKY